MDTLEMLCAVRGGKVILLIILGSLNYLSFDRTSSPWMTEESRDVPTYESNVVRRFTTKSKN